MTRLQLLLPLLLVVCFCLATKLQPRWSGWQGDERESDDALALLLGDGRRMFADAFYDKADAYFHRGNYPSIFDLEARVREDHMAGEAHGEHPSEDSGHEEQSETSPPRDWIERFGRHFRPSTHVHLGGGEEREMLPWLRIAASLDPHRVDTYTVAAYWLWDRLGNADEAERFLREGLKANPNDPELLYELGRLQFEARKDLSRAQNLFSAALQRWNRVERPKEKPDLFLLEKIVGGLARIETERGHYAEAIDYLKQLKSVSPNPDAIQKQIDVLSRRLPDSSPPKSQ